MKIVYSLLILLCTVGSVNASSEFSFKHDEQVVAWWLGGMRGVWHGFYRGFYHESKKLSAKCLSDKAADEFDTILQFLAYGELSDIFTVADSLSSLYFDNKEYCGETEILGTVL